MKLDIQSIGKAFAPGVMSKAVKAFDRATMIVVITCWTGALLIMLFALYTLGLSVKAKKEMTEAAAGEPSLPKISTNAPEAAEVQPMVDRLKKMFPDINFSLSRDHALSVSTTDVRNFRLWLTVLSYIDTFSPQYRWTLKGFCVGARCDKSVPMQAVLSAEKISFAAPEVEQK